MAFEQLLEIFRRDRGVRAVHAAGQGVGADLEMAEAERLQRAKSSARVSTWSIERAKPRLER